MEETFAPDNIQLLLMGAALIVVVTLIVWRNFAPRWMRSKLVFDSEVKRAWLLLETEDEKVAFTHMVIDAVKSDGKISGDEAEAIYEEMDLDYKHKAADMTPEKMFDILHECNKDQKAAIVSALRELLIADGKYDDNEKAWFDEVKSKLA